MTPEQLKASIIQSALEGKITQQRSEDTPVAETLNRIQELRNAMINRKEIKKVAVLPIDDTEPFDIPDSWKWVRIGAIEEINLGFTYRPEYTDEGVYFLSVKDISGGKIDFQNAKKVSQETYDNAAYGSKPRKGDILFGRVGTMGKPQIIDTDEPFCIFVSLGFFRDHTNIVVKEYISLWMQSVLFNKQVDENVKGSAQRNLNTGWLKDFYIPFPPIEEQHRIVAKIEELLPYVDRYAEAYEKLEQFNAKFPEDMKKSILQYAIQGKLVEQRPEEGNAEDLYQKIHEEKQRLIKKGKIKKEKPLADITEDEIPFDIPDSWKWCRIGSVFTLQAGKNITASQIYNDKSEKTQYPCYGGNGIRGYVNEPNRRGHYAIIGRQGALCGCINFAKGDFYATEHAVVVDHYNITDTKWSGLFLKALNLNQYATATAQPGLSVANINQVLIPLPPLGEQKRIVSKMEELLPYCDRLITQK